MPYLIAVKFLRPFAARVRELGHDPRSVAMRLGMSSARSGAADERWFRAQQVRAFFDLAAVEAGDADLGLNAANRHLLGSTNAFAFAVQSAPNLREALKFIASSGARNEVGLEVRFEEDEHEARLTFAAPSEPEGLGRHGNEFRVAALVQRLSEAVGQDWRPSRAWFSNPEPKHSALIATVLGTSDLQFLRHESGFSLAQSWLDAPLRHSDPALHAFVRQLIIEDLSRTPKAVSSLFKDKLCDLVAHGSFDADSLAHSLHMSRRTLQRRLAEEGTTFHSLLDEVRSQEARGLRSVVALSPEEIARRLGYTSHRAFQRASRRWKG